MLIRAGIAAQHGIVFSCTKEGCREAAEWEPTVVVVKSDEEVRVDIPTAVCTHHRRGFRALLLEGGLPAAEAILSEQGVDLRAAIFRLEFTPLN